MCMMIRGAADRLWWMKIWCVQLKRRSERTDDSPLHHLAPIDFHLFLHLKSFLAGRRLRQRGQRSRYHLLCIAGGGILRWRDTKTGATLWQVPQQWWELCWKVVYGVYIKWQYTWFVIYSCFFINSPSELTFWIAYVNSTAARNQMFKAWVIIKLYVMSWSIRESVCVRVCVCARARVHAHACFHWHAYICVCVCACTHVCSFIQVCACSFVCVCIIATVGWRLIGFDYC